MLARADTVATIAEKWLAQFERALAAPSRARLETLFHADSHWRDVLALTWHIKTVSGAEAILRELGTHAARPTGFRLDPHRTAPRNVRRAGTDAIEAILRFETAQGRGSGVLRLIPDADDGNAFRAWTLLIRAIFADRTGSTCARLPPNMPAASPRRSSWAVDRPDFRSPLASRNWAWIR